MSHAKCADGHTCQVPSGRICIKTSCEAAAGTRWGPLWCPEHDQERLDRVSAGFDRIEAEMAAAARTEGLGTE